MADDPPTPGELDLAALGAYAERRRIAGISHKPEGIDGDEWAQTQETLATVNATKSGRASFPLFEEPGRADAGPGSLGSASGFGQAEVCRAGQSRDRT
jgi:hypothetical protein